MQVRYRSDPITRNGSLATHHTALYARARLRAHLEVDDLLQGWEWHGLVL
jgi:hypothetical protein